MKRNESDKPPPEGEQPAVSASASGENKEPQRRNVEAPHPLPLSPQERRVTEKRRTIHFTKKGKLSLKYNSESHTEGPTSVLPELFKRLYDFVKELLGFVRALRR